MLLTHALRAVQAPTAPQTYPQYVSNTTGSTVAGAGPTVTINKPANVASGDLLVAVLVANATAGWNQLSGWTRLNNITTDPSTSVQFRIADGTEGASFVFSQTSGTTRCAGTIMRFTNAGIPYVGTSNSNVNNTTPHIAPSLTIGDNGSLSLSVFTSDSAGITWTGVDGTNILSFTTECSINIGYSEVNAGATAADTATPSTSISYASFQIGIPLKAAPLFIAGSMAETSATVTSLAVNVPAGARAGDLLVAFGMLGSPTGTHTPPTGWTERLDANGRNIASLGYYDGTTSSYTFTFSSSGGARFQILCFRNATFGAVSAISASATDPVAPSISIPVNNSIWIAYASSSDPGMVYTTPTGFADVVTPLNTIVTQKIVSNNSLQSSGTTTTVTFVRTSGSLGGRAAQLSISSI